MQKQKCIVRLYVLDAFELAGLDLDGNSDPYVSVKFGDKVVVRNKKGNKSTRNPVFNEFYEFEATFPGPATICIEVMDYDTIGADDLIGETHIDIESRFFNARFMAMPCVPIEERQLTCKETSSNRGIIRCWVDIIKEADVPNVPIWNILPRPSLKF